MKHRWFIRFALACSAALLIWSLTGCDRLDKTPQTEQQTEKPTEKQTERATEKATEKQTEKTTEAQTTGLQENVVYISKDKSIRIVLPDGTWKVTQDVDEMRVFSSDAAMINIVHAKTESELKRLAVSESEEELQAALARQYPEANAFEIESFEHLSVRDLNSYQYVVKYNSKSMWAYAVTFEIMAENEAYVVTGTVTDDNRALLNAVIDSVGSFAVLTNPVFDLTAPQTEAVQTETSATGDAAADEQFKSLSLYGYETSLIAADEVNIRKEPSTDADILGSLAKGEKVTVTGETKEWFRVLINGQTAYVSKQFLIYGDGQTGNTAQTEAAQQETSADVSSMQSAEIGSEIDYGEGYTYYATSEVNLRAQPGTDAGILDSLYTGAAVQVVGETDNWYVVSVNGQKAYVSKSYISSDAPASAGGTAGSSDNQAADTVVDDSSDTGLAISGTVSSVSDGVMVVAGDDGNTYTVAYAPEAVNAADGLYEGLYVSASVNGEADGSYTASSVTGY